MVNTNRSMTLDNVDKFDIGRKFDICSWSRPGFFSSGSTWAVLKDGESDIRQIIESFAGVTLILLQLLSTPYS